MKTARASGSIPPTRKMSSIALVQLVAAQADPSPEMVACRGCNSVGNTSVGRVRGATTPMPRRSFRRANIALHVASS